MAIAVIVEDGTGISNANSYVTIAQARSYAQARGLDLSANVYIDDAIAAMLIKATDYLEAQACKYQGFKSNFANSLEWPRSEVFFNNSDIEYPNNSIPNNLKNAQCALIIAVANGLDLLPNTTAQDFITEETIGPITTKYANPIQSGISPQFAAADALLAPLFGSCKSTFSIFSQRV